MRFEVMTESKSAHCCFEATVIDTQTDDEFGEAKTICECFELEDARFVAEALNAR